MIGGHFYCYPILLKNITRPRYSGKIELIVLKRFLSLNLTLFPNSNPKCVFKFFELVNFGQRCHQISIVVCTVCRANRIFRQHF